MRGRDRDSQLGASPNFSPPLPLHMFLCHLPVAIDFFFLLQSKGYVRVAHTFIASFAFGEFAMVTDAWMRRRGSEEEREEKRMREEQAE